MRFPPTERRDTRRFEVPPWEQKQFEELQEHRASEHSVDQQYEPEHPAAAPQDGTAQREQLPRADEPKPEPASNAPSPEKETEGPAFDAMLAQLAAQEQTGTKSVETVSIVSGALLVVIGCVLVVWAVAAFVASRRAGAVGAFGGAVLLLFGAGFVAGGIWTGTKHLR